MVVLVLLYRTSTAILSLSLRAVGVGWIFTLSLRVVSLG